MSKKEDAKKDLRRYPRVLLTKGIQGFDRIMGVEAHWPDGLSSGLLDISYIGAAILKSPGANQKYNKGDKVELLLSFAGGDTNVLFNAEIMRDTDKFIGVSFPSLSFHARKSLESFLKQKLIGMSTKLVSSKFYTKDVTFDYWFHGPNQTNIYIWESSKEIKKAVIELHNDIITYEDEKFYLSKSVNYLKTANEDYTYNANHPTEKKPLDKDALPAALMHDVISLLGQIEDPTGHIKKLYAFMVQTVLTHNS